MRSAFTADEENGLRPLFRKAFSGETGVKLLGVLLKSLGFFDRVENDEQKALRNYAVWVLEILGVNQEVNLLDITRKMMEIPVDLPKERVDE